MITIKTYVAPRKAIETSPCQILLKDDSQRRYFLRRDLKVANDVEFVMSGGREFQTAKDMSETSFGYIISGTFF